MATLTTEENNLRKSLANDQQLLAEKAAKILMDNEQHWWNILYI